MKYEQKITDRQVGRNADLLAAKIGEYKTAEERYPFIRILISIIEQAHPEWNQAPNKDKQIAHLVFHMSHGAITREETEHIIHLRDMERGYIPLPEKEQPAENDVDENGESNESDNGDAASEENGDSSADDGKSDDGGQEEEVKRPKRGRKPSMRKAEKAASSDDERPSDDDDESSDSDSDSEEEDKED